ncbi:MAG: rRNA methyltransferase [Chlamydiae bacterium]|nr:rRNA methyltransferase [Chlamydiota bacterium]
MQLPEILQSAIEERISFQSLNAISEASSELTSRYRRGPSHESYVRSEKDRLAYILSRLPATYSVICKVFSELNDRLPGFAPRSFLDLGAGPGTGLWSAKESFSSITESSAWEYDEGFIELGKKLATKDPTLARAIWSKKNFEIDRDFPEVDLALLSYSIGEIEEKFWDPFLQNLWNKVKSTLVIIEPGTPAGYKRILKIRDILLQDGAKILAPCPHSGSCPLKDPDWCHFTARVERSSLHRKVKNAALNYEDEKFSYLIFSKEQNISLFESRILRFPQIHKGHVCISLCTKSEGIIQKTITKKDKEKYKYVKKCSWGDVF